MAIPVDLLTDLARGLQVARSGPAEVAPGQLVGVKLLPPASDLRVTDVVSGALDLTFITKNVRFEEATLQSALDGTLDADILGGIPLTGLNPLPGVPGSSDSSPAPCRSRSSCPCGSRCVGASATRRARS